MARTKQTARMSKGPRAPRRGRINMTYSGGEAQSTQVEIFQQKEKRTLVVEGTAELTESPDLISLSFLVEESASTLGASVQAVIEKISQLRSIVVSCGVPNEDISSDSIGSSMERIEYRKKQETTARQSRGAGANAGNMKTIATRTLYRSRSVARICLEGENATNLLSKVCLEILSAGFRSHEAPLYESTKITERRNLARKQACENAKDKAQCIIRALGDPSVKLGAPIALTDVHCDIGDDAEESFLGNMFHPTIRYVDVSADEGDEWKFDDDDRVKKKARMTTNEDDKETAPVAELKSMDLDQSQIFVAPPIRIAARIKAIFEIETDETSKST